MSDTVSFQDHGEQACKTMQWSVMYMNNDCCANAKSIVSFQDVVLRAAKKLLTHTQVM